MNQGVEILLKRMESHPEEFCIDLNQEWQGTEGKWQHVTRCIYTRMQQLGQIVPTLPASSTVVLPFLTNEEVQALHTKLMSIQSDAFTEMVVRNIMQEPETEDNDWAVDVAPGTKMVPSSQNPFGLAVMKREGKKVKYDPHNPGMKYRK